MAEKTYLLEVVTPRKIVFNGEVESFSAPGVMGGFQVLYNHAPMLAAVGVGEVKIRDAAGQDKRFATSGGFVEVVKNHVVMLAETIESPQEIDTARAEAARQRAANRLAERQEGIDAERARAALLRAINRLKVNRNN